MSDTALPPGPPPSGLQDLDFESMIKRAADLHFAPAAPNADGTPSASLPPAVEMVRKQTPAEFIRQLNKMPLFMTELDETGEDDESPNEALDAIKALQYEGSDLDVAKNFKTQGNECFKERDFKNARVYYTKALAVKFEDQELELSCINNRAQCNLLMGNYGKALADCRASLARNATNDKPWFRSAKALLQLDKLTEAIACIENAAAINPTHTEIKSLAVKIAQRKKYLEQQEASRIAREKTKKREEAMMKIALEARGISTRKNKDQLNPLAGEYVVRFETKDDPATQLLWPTMLVYYQPGIDFRRLQEARSDLIAGFPERMTVGEQMAEVLAQPVDADYRPGNVDVYMETKTGGLVKVGQRVSLLEALSNPKVEVVDGVVTLYVVAKRFTEEFVKTWKLQKMRST